MMGLLSLVGSPIARIVGSVLVATLIFWLLIQYGQNMERERQEQQDLRENLETRERIDDSIQDTIGIDPRDALEQLRNRQ